MRPSRLLLCSIAVSAMLVGGVATATPSVASHGGGGGGGSSTNSPPFDFTDAFYTGNGVDPAGLVGRRSGTDGLSTSSPAPDANHRNVRVQFTLPAYDLSGNEPFFTVLADLAPTAFTTTSAGVKAKQRADASPVYVFPTRTGDPLSVANNRQADMIDTSNGYSNNPLGLWVHVFVTWTPKAFNTTGGKKALADLAKQNGLALDGTPIIKSESQLDSLTKSGYLVQTERSATSDGTPLPAEQQFVTDFNSLQTTGDYPH